MSKSARLIEVASNVLGVPEKTVRSRVMLLRKNSLWSSIGKGISADPAPSDASNLLLSFLGGGLVTETAETVRLLRNCLYVAPSKNEAPPPIGLFAEFGREHTLGEVLDALFTQWSEHGPPVSLDSNLPFTTVSLAIERYSHGWDVEFSFRLQLNPLTTQETTSPAAQDTTHSLTPDSIIRGEFEVFTEPQRALSCKTRGEEQWLVEYEFFPELLPVTNKRQLARAARRLAETRGDLITSARVSERTFTALAECLSQPTHRASRRSLGQHNRLAN